MLTRASEAVVESQSDGRLGDRSDRDYTRKLMLFNEFAASEIRQCILSLGLRPGMNVLDAGCGTGASLEWLQEAVSPAGRVIGVDLSAAHVAAASTHRSAQIEIMQANFMNAAFTPASFDLVWCTNTINHLSDPVRGVRYLAGLLRPGGRVALAQSSLLPDMFFAWDARLERMTNEAVRQYYRDRYHLTERELTSVRALVGLLRAVRLTNIAVQTVVIERINPLDAATESYLSEAIFKNTWGERLRPYLTAEDYAELVDLCNPQSSRYALRRPDFHFLQTFTLATGEI
jgi:ubiquinone/menaquinone biosynthesis C-methylase UbiE